VLHGLRSRPLVDVSKTEGVRAGLATLLAGFFDGPAIDPSPVLLGETLIRLVSHLAADDGALVVLDDLHWACGDTLAVTSIWPTTRPVSAWLSSALCARARRWTWPTRLRDAVARR
jgi:hypothetical protein